MNFQDYFQWEIISLVITLNLTKIFGNALKSATSNYSLGDFPGGPVGETLRSQCEGPGFHSWSEN